MFLSALGTIASCCFCLLLMYIKLNRYESLMQEYDKRLRALEDANNIKH